MCDISEYSIHNPQFQSDNLIRKTRFELISLYGRLFLNKKPKLSKGANLLHLGCGETMIKDWVNAGFYRIQKFWKKTVGVQADWMLDLRYPLNCDDNVWDGIFCEHTLEHLYPIYALKLLKELHRTMKPKTWLRINVPDLKKYIDYYNGNVPHENFLRWKTGCEAVRSLTQNWWHLSVWDVTLLSQFLKKAGLINIREVEYRGGTDARLLKDSADRHWESLYIEAQKA